MKHTDLLTKRRKRRRYTTLSSNTALVVTCTIVSQDFFPLNDQKGIDLNTKKKRKEKKMLRESHFRPIHCKKCLGTINLIKWQFMQRLDVEWSGITLACSDWWASIVCLQISVWGGKRQREDGYYVGKRKMLCWASAALSRKVSDSLFPLHSERAGRGRSQEGRLLSCHGSGASWRSDSGRGRPAGSRTMGWSAEGIVNCMCVRGKRGGCERGGVLSWSRTFSSNLVQAFL